MKKNEAAILDEVEAIYACPCGNTAKFIEEGTAPVKQTIYYHRDKAGQVVGSVEDEEVGAIDPTTVTCASCGAKV